ncbi:ANTH domain-containing protein [Bombardia bombarda]|uniref:ANTH domain-containing protein n=1 Tax=Bombardia bombarda TaxID=252184 RepID=A0AA39WZT6_9PEZI|nr:ANTH domain-containing protein [Bombardia bombarda]
MASSFEKSVKGATKIKAAPPKTKYIEHILIATHSGEAGVGEVFRALQNRLHDSTWTVVFKSLITAHLMIREGSADVTLAYLAKHNNILAVSMFSDAQTQGRNIRHYSDYLTERARAYRETKIDWVRGKEARLEKLTVEKGLLRETEAVQHQLTALLKCDVMESEQENEITVTVFRLLVLDLLALFQALNQAMINILGHFFEMSKPDAERAMDIYRTFTRQTDFVVQYLSVARQYEHHTRVEVPKLKHAPVNLGRQLEEYLKDPDFEIHRRQYLAELEAKKSKGGSAGASKSARSEPASKADTAKAFSSVNGSQQAAPQLPQPTKGPDANLIDFFESIEHNQTPMATQQFPSNGFAPQQTGLQMNGSFQQQQPMGGFAQPQQLPQQIQTTGFTSPVGYGGFSPQSAFQPSSLASIPQDSVANFQMASPTGFQGGLQPAPQTTNPFRQSMLMNQQTGSPFAPVAPQQQQPQQQQQQQQPRPLTSQSTNPFARSSPQATQPFAAPMPLMPNNSPFQSPPPIQQQAAPMPLQSMATGTNPFARGFAQQQQQQPQQQQEQPRPVTAGGALMSQPTGSTNPFRQGAFVNHTTGVGWQHNQQSIGGGLDQLETIPVFPRPAQQTPWQQ